MLPTRFLSKTDFTGEGRCDSLIDSEKEMAHVARKEFYITLRQRVLENNACLQPRHFTEEA